MNNELIDLLSFLADVRIALGDHGERMQADLVVYAKEVKARADNADRLQAENRILRGLLPSLGAPCVYCGEREIAKCRHGFPGCSAADDILSAQDEMWKNMFERVRAAEAALKKCEG